MNIHKTVYEYRVVAADWYKSNVDNLNKLAMEGWDIVYCYSRNTDLAVLLRREAGVIDIVVPKGQDD